jgi:RNA polymerase sigma-70 factor (ECF subfamily)
MWLGGIKPASSIARVSNRDIQGGAKMAQPVGYEVLFSGAVRGDRQATERLLLQYAAHLRARIGLRLPSSLQSVVDADDVLQEVYIHAIRDISTCQAGSPEAFAAWLNSVADHRVGEIVRNQGCQKRGGGMQRVLLGGPGSESAWGDGLVPDSCPTPCRAAAQHEAVAAVRDALEALPAEQREAVRLHALEGQTLATTAQNIRRSPDAVRGLVHRAKQRLRELMQSSSRWFDKK